MGGIEPVNGRMFDTLGGGRYRSDPGDMAQRQGVAREEEEVMRAYYNIYIIDTNDTVLERAKGVSAARLPEVITHLEEKHRDQLQAGNVYIGIEALALQMELHN